jgi:predicted nucleic acid-binding protein
MSDNIFVDTNILLYARDSSEPEKQAVAAKRLDELWDGRNGKLSVQVLNEFTVNARNPEKLNLSTQKELDWIERWLLFPIHKTTVETFLEARLFHEHYQVSHWNGLILAAAKETRCEILYPEDLNPGQTYDGVEAVNPFDPT